MTSTRTQLYRVPWLGTGKYLRNMLRFVALRVALDRNLLRLVLRNPQKTQSVAGENVLRFLLRLVLRNEVLFRVRDG